LRTIIATSNPIETVSNQVNIKYYLNRRDSDPFTTATLLNIDLHNTTRAEFINSALDALGLPSGCCDQEYRDTAVFKIESTDPDSQGASFSKSTTIVTDRQWAVVTPKLKYISAMIASFINESYTASAIFEASHE
jgi:hypothetical protein